MSVGLSTLSFELVPEYGLHKLTTALVELLRQGVHHLLDDFLRALGEHLQVLLVVLVPLLGELVELVFVPTNLVLQIFLEVQSHPVLELYELAGLCLPRLGDVWARPLDQVKLIVPADPVLDQVIVPHHGSHLLHKVL